MKLYLAGAITGNLIKEWKEFIDIYLAGVGMKKKTMKLFLAGNDGYRKERFDLFAKELYCLESFHYITKQEWMFPLFKMFKGFLLDSGAFTFMVANKKEKVDWDKYIIEYAEFINKHNIDLFFELDIDPIVGLKEVERLRAKLEKITNKQCIPVWHKSRGLEYWKKMCKEYNYIAIGGLVTGEIKRSEYDIFIPLLKIAKENDCKVHGLGFTNLKGMERYKFNSVDSTSWLSGNKFGSIYFFNGKTMCKIKAPEGKRLKANKAALHNFTEWVKFSKYAEQNL